MIGDSFPIIIGVYECVREAAGVSILAQGTSSCISYQAYIFMIGGIIKDKIYQDCYEQTEKYYRMIQKNQLRIM
ncbi:hypothetical protein PGH43_00020 [Legionella pneumophila 130b]|nr:hypothetical protein PGH43_00020 [Legionella pneumophila 130b]